MVRKRKLPWGVLAVLLVLLLVGAYYMGGLFGMDGVNRSIGRTIWGISSHTLSSPIGMRRRLAGWGLAFSRG